MKHAQLIAGKLDSENSKFLAWLKRGGFSHICTACERRGRFSRNQNENHVHNSGNVVCNFRVKRPVRRGRRDANVQTARHLGDPPRLSQTCSRLHHTAPHGAKHARNAKDACCKRATQLAVASTRADTEHAVAAWSNHDSDSAILGAIAQRNTPSPLQ